MYVQFAELFVGQRGSYLEKEVSLLRIRLVDTLASVAGEVGLTSMEKPKQKRLIGKTKGGGEKAAADLPALRFDKVRRLLYLCVLTVSLDSLYMEGFERGHLLALMCTNRWSPMK